MLADNCLHVCHWLLTLVYSCLHVSHYLLTLVNNCLHVRYWLLTLLLFTCVSLAVNAGVVYMCVIGY